MIPPSTIDHYFSRALANPFPPCYNNFQNPTIPVGFTVLVKMMRISTRSEYAVRVLLELGMRNGEEVSLHDVAQRWRISLDYLEQLMPPLKKAGLVRSRRGAKGGYAVAKPLDDITVADILEALEGPVKVMDCLRDETACWASGACAIQDTLQEVRQAIDGVLRGVTLADLVEKQQRKTGREVKVYHI